MSLTISGNLTAIAPGISTVFGAQGGTEDYTYSVVPDGAGGSIDAESGVYLAPPTVNSDVAKQLDTIMVTDAADLTATCQILVATPLGLLCDILQTELGLSPGRVYLWDQKLMQPKDNDLYAAVAMISCKPFGNTIEYDGDGEGLDGIQSVNMKADVQIDLISRGPAARDRKEEVLMAMKSVYAQQQQEANSFQIASLSTSFVNNSNSDGSAIPYRFTITLGIQYFVRKVKAVAYIDEFAPVEVTTEP